MKGIIRNETREKCEICLKEIKDQFMWLNADQSVNHLKCAENKFHELKQIIK